ncbi:hypothetical protein [Streptomyces sp. NPDC102437]|uniref:hypothetical protein n=1 Tax=Streptomyces sp. NPDC102437 TaxID=3366175 RepID=UPI00382AD17B
MTMDLLGVDYLRPAQEPCPDCACCMVDLCRKGRASVRECAAFTHDDLKSVVAVCPCSAATTEGTASWRDAMVNATRQAAELPLPEPAEGLLRAMARQDPDVLDPAGFIIALRLRQFVRGREGGFTWVTSLGQAYLAALDGERVATRVFVLTVDVKANTAGVIVAGWSTETAVTVLLDHLVQATGLEVPELLGTFLEAVANVDAERAQEIVLTDIRPVVEPLPQVWKAIPAAIVAKGQEAGDE